MKYILPRILVLFAALFFAFGSYIRFSIIHDMSATESQIVEYAFLMFMCIIMLQTATNCFLGYRLSELEKRLPPVERRP